jgi:hypothetical protein
MVTSLSFEAAYPTSSKYIFTRTGPPSSKAHFPGILQDHQNALKYLGPGREE